MAVFYENNIGGALKYTATRYPERCAVDYGGKTYSWAELDAEVTRAAEGLTELGVRRGDNVAIWSANNPSFIISFFAVTRVGAVAVLFNTSWSEEEFKEALVYSDIGFLMFGTGYSKTDFREICSRLDLEAYPLLKKLIYIGTNEETRWPTLATLPRSDKKWEEPGLEDVAAILFTSGTTAKPKGVMLLHRAMLQNAYITGEALRITEKDVFCIALPMFHCFCLMANILTALSKGASMIITTKSEYRKILEKITDKHCTVFNAVPTLLLRQIDRLGEGNFDLSSLRVGIIGGAPYSVEQYARICEELHFECLMASIGQTEATAGFTMTDYDDPFIEKAATLGRFMDGFEGKIIDAATGKEVAPGTDGEICIRSSMVMKGYYKMPERTAETLDAEGWLRTGDVGFVGSDGRLRLTGRKKDIAIRGGENVSLAEVEKVISGAFEISAVKALGVPDPMYGEEICACIVKGSEKNINEEQVRHAVSLLLAKYKVPKYVLFFDELPSTASGKVRAEKLRPIVLEKLGISAK